MIRKSITSDLEKIRRILECSPEAAQWSLSSLSLAVSSNSQVLVSECEGEITGVIAFRAVAGEAEILNLAILPEWRRRGLGRELMYAAIAHSREMGAQRLFLEVRESNGGARTFYSRMQFTEYGRRTAYYRDPAEDAIFLSRTIE